MMRSFGWYCSVIAGPASVPLCRQLASISIATRRNMNDSAELNHVTYGLFSVDQCKRQIAALLVEEIDKLSLSDAHELVLASDVQES